MGLLEPITHKEEIENLLNEAQTKYDTALNNFNKQKDKTADCLEELGKVKIKAWSEGMDSFVTNFSAFNNIEIIKTVDTNVSFIGSSEEPQQMIVNMQQASLTASEVAKAGVAAVGSGALIGIASYGGAMMFGTASTGTAIAALSGAAKTNATLAFFGGGSKAVGGLGIAGGKLVLAGIVAAPVLAVAAVITSVKSKERLAEAKKIHAEAIDAAEKMNMMTTGMNGIEKMSDNYSDFIKKLGKKFKPFVVELECIKKAHPVQDGGQIEFNSLTTVEQKTLHLSWLMAQIYYHVLSTPILTADGKVSMEAKQVIDVANKEFKQFKKDTFKLSGEDAQAANILWHSSANMMLLLNLVVSIAMLGLGVFAFRYGIMRGLVFIVSAMIAFPIFFKIKIPSDSRLWLYRIYRLIAACAFAVIMQCIL